MKKEIEGYLYDIFLRIGIDRPANMDQIVEFCAEDVRVAADPDNWNSDDVNIAFRRFIEQQTS